MKILITGGGGFIGSHLADRLLSEGHEVLTVDTYATSRRDNLTPQDGLTIVEGSIADEAFFDKVVDDFGPDAIAHAAASYKDPDAWAEDARTNALGTAIVVKAAERVGAKRFVYFQTALCYGVKPEEQPITLNHPLRPYESSATRSPRPRARTTSACRSLDWVSFRLANVYGPRNLSGPLPTFFSRLTADKACFVTDTRRDFLFVTDLVDVVVKALNGTGSGAYHVSSGSDVSIKELFDATTAALDLGDDRRRDPPARRRRRRVDPARPLAHRGRLRLEDQRRDARRRRAGGRLVPRARHRADLHAPQGRGAARPMKVLVAGGAGFVGSNLVRALLARGDEVTVVDNLLSAERENVPEGASLIEASINDDDVLAAIPEDLDLAFNLVTYHGNQSSMADPLADHEHNLLTSLKLFMRLSELPSLQKVVYAGAGCTVAEKTFESASATQEDAPVSLYLDSPYQISKVVGELYGNYFWMRKGLPMVKARFQNVYGPGEVLGAGRWRGTVNTVWRNVTPTFVWKALHGEALPLDNGGIATRDFIYRRGHGARTDRLRRAGRAGRRLQPRHRRGDEHPRAGRDDRGAGRHRQRRGRTGARLGPLGQALRATREVRSASWASARPSTLREGLERQIAWTRENEAFIASCIAKHDAQMAAAARWPTPGSSPRPRGGSRPTCASCGSTATWRSSWSSATSRSATARR